MVNPSCLFIRAMNSTLWIAVLVVHVGCIIEAQPSKNPQVSGSSILTTSNNEKRTHYSSSFDLTSAASYNTRQNSARNSLLLQKQYRARKYLPKTLSLITYSSTTIKPLLPVVEKSREETDGDDDDSCTGKGDGYYQNFGSNCVSYYFCAAGYQITYICPPGEKFNGKKCDDDFTCPEKKGIVNSCENLPNGYYPNLKHPGKYFYCFQKSKVIELQCEIGKVFINDECILPPRGQEIKQIYQNSSPQIFSQSQNSQNSNLKVDESSNSCADKSNGFYTDSKTGCKNYYYCINGDKTQLSCQSGFLFNGDICVHSSRYTCPTKLVETHDDEIILSYGSNSKGYIDKGQTENKSELEVSTMYTTLMTTGSQDDVTSTTTTV